MPVKKKNSRKRGILSVKGVWRMENGECNSKDWCGRRRTFIDWRKENGEWRM